MQHHGRRGVVIREEGPLDARVADAIHVVKVELRLEDVVPGIWSHGVITIVFPTVVYITPRVVDVRL